MHPATAKHLRAEDVAMIQHRKTTYASLRKHMSELNSELNICHARHGEHNDQYGALYDIHESFAQLRDEMDDVLSCL